MDHAARMAMAMATKGFLGIDAGTQGLSVVFADESMNVIATGDGGYSMILAWAKDATNSTPATGWLHLRRQWKI